MMVTELGTTVHKTELYDLNEGRHARLMAYQPLWGTWEIKEMVGAGTTSVVYRVENDININSALKVITIRYDNNGHSIEKGGKWLLEKKDTKMQEIKLLSELRGIGNIVSYEDYVCHEIHHNINGKIIGYDILIRMELLESLAEKMKESYYFTENEILRIG